MSYAFPLSIDWHCLCGDGPASHNTKASGEECYGHCQKTDHDCRGFGYRPIEHTGRTPAISAIFTVAGQDPRWPRHYTSDLSLDYQRLIAADAPDRFLWIARESGTHLLSLNDEGDTDWHAGYIRSGLEWLATNHPEALVFHWNGFALDPINFDTAKVLAALPPIRRGVTFKLGQPEPAFPREDAHA